MEKKRFNVFIPPDLEKDIRDMSEKLGLGLSDLSTLLMTAGMYSLKISQDPIWKSYFEGQINESISKIGTKKKRGGKKVDESKTAA